MSICCNSLNPKTPEGTLMIVLLFGVIVGLLTSCNDSDLVPLNASSDPQNQVANVTVNFCTDPALNQKIVQKMVIILDHSGSNAENYLMASDGSGAPALVNGDIVISTQYATDPTGFTRYGSINTPGTLLNYLYNLPANDPTNPSLEFALIDFNSTATSYPAGNTGFTSDISSFYDYVLTDAGGYYPNNNPPTDTGDTNYLAALGDAYTIINTDIQNVKNCAALAVGSASPGSWCPTPGDQTSSYYTIVFMSDGSPITSIGGVGEDANGNIVVTGPITIVKQPTDEILAEVSTIMGLASNSQYVAGMELFTVYYYHPGNVDLSGQTLLSQMAQVGNGIAYNATSGSNIDYQTFLPSTKHIKYTLSDIFVTNSSVVMEADGNAHLDTDMDGMADDQEKINGTNPDLTDTFGLGISDMVLNAANGSAPCQTFNALGICTDPLPALVINLSTGVCKGVTGSSDPDGLTDCEKLVLSDTGGINNPDSNGDGIPDWLELKNGVPFQLGTAPPVTSPGLDGMSIYDKIKLSLPANTPLYQLLNVAPSVYTMNMVSTSDVQDCYQLDVSNLPVSASGATNTVRVDVIEKNELTQSQKLYRVGAKQIPAGTSSIQFNDWNNTAEQSLGTWKTWP
jgi:hypothetical protein